MRPALLKALLWIAPVLLPHAGHCQGSIENVYVYGMVKDLTSGDSIPNARLTVIDRSDSTVLREALSDERGRYEMVLGFDTCFAIHYEAVGRVPKHVVIDTRHIPDSARAGGFGMNINMTMFFELDGVDFSILQAPIGMCAFDPETTTLNWDFAYTTLIQSRVKALMDDYKAKKGGASALGKP